MVALITVKTNGPLVARQLRQLGRRDFPRVFRNVVNDLAFEGRQAEVEQMHRDLHRPTRFTASPQTFVITKALATPEPTSFSTMKRKQARYLQWQISGGTQLPNPGRTYIPVPTKNEKRNFHGNVPGKRSRMRRLTKQKTITYVNKPLGGVYRRNKKLREEVGVRGLKLWHFARTTRYNRRYRWGRGYERYVKRNSARIIRREIRVIARKNARTRR